MLPARALGLDPKQVIHRTRWVDTGAASGKQLGAAFNLKAGDAGAPLSLGQNWLFIACPKKPRPTSPIFEKQRSR